MLADIIPKIARMEADEEQAYRPRPSMAGPERCVRQMYYHRINEEKRSLAGRAILVFDDSSWHEELTLNWLRKTFAIHSEQMHVDIGEMNGITLGGSIDALFTDILDVDRLLEHKAINHFTFQKYWDGTDLPLDYLSQMALYLHGLRKINPDLRQGVLLIKNKNTAQYIEYNVELAGEDLHVHDKVHSNGEVAEIKQVLYSIVRNAFDKFALVESRAKRQHPPERQYEYGHWRCDYCPYGETCWADYEEEFALMEMGQVFESDVADTIRFYKESKAQEGEIRKEAEKVDKELKELLHTLGKRQGVAGEYQIELRLVTREYPDMDQVPAQYRRYKKAMWEQLFISKRKEPKGRKKG